MDPDRTDVIVFADCGPAAFPKPRRVLVGRAEPGPDDRTPLVLGPLAVDQIYEAVQREQLEHLTTVARALAADLHAQLAQVPGGAQAEALVVEAGHLVEQIERIRTTVRRQA